MLVRNVLLLFFFKDFIFFKGSSKNVLLENHFALIKIVAQSGFGREFKMKHLKTGITVAVKEILREEKDCVKLWNKLIYKIGMLEKKIPDLATSRFIGILDDTDSNIKEKYIISEWIEGK